MRCQYGLHCKSVIQRLHFDQLETCQLETTNKQPYELVPALAGMTSRSEAKSLDDRLRRCEALPAYAGMTSNAGTRAIPAFAGMARRRGREPCYAGLWIPGLSETDSSTTSIAVIPAKAGIQ